MSAHRSTSQEPLFPVDVTDGDEDKDLHLHILGQMFAFVSSDTNLEARLAPERGSYFDLGNNTFAYAYMLNKAFACFVCFV